VAGRDGGLPGGTKTLPPGALTSTSGGGVECDAPISVALYGPMQQTVVLCYKRRLSSMSLPRYIVLIVVVLLLSTPSDTFAFYIDFISI